MRAKGDELAVLDHAGSPSLHAPIEGVRTVVQVDGVSESTRGEVEVEVERPLDGLIGDFDVQPEGLEGLADLPDPSAKAQRGGCAFEDADAMNAVGDPRAIPCSRWSFPTS